MRTPTLPSIGLFFCLSLVASAQMNHRSEAFPQQNFGRNSRAGEIPALLGSKLPQIAAWYDKTEKELKDLCLKDKTLRMDRQGHLHYVCEGLLPLQNAIVKGTTATGGTTSPSGTLSVTDTFLLHSKPGASKVIYLDFDGHTTSGTSWNSSFTGGANIDTPPPPGSSRIFRCFSRRDKRLRALRQRPAGAPGTAATSRRRGRTARPRAAAAGFRCW